MNNIRTKRRMLNMTMKQLAAKVGVTEAAISHYETGRREPDPDMLGRIANALGVSVDYLLCRDGAPVSSGEMASYDFGDGETKMSPADKRAEGKNLLQIATDKEYDDFVNYMRYTLSKRKDGGQK